jgi:glycosyltransferase involved in cell wall biosynthesis
MESSLSKKKEIIRERNSINKYDFYKPKKILVVAWAHHSLRSKKIADSLNAKLFIKGYRSRAKILSILKYIKLSINTLNVLNKEKPDIIICQLPPLFLAFSILLYKFLTFSNKPDIILDLHTAAFCKPWSYFGYMNKYLYKKALQLIVTNRQLLNDIDNKYRNKVLVLEDAILDRSVTKIENNISSSSSSSSSSNLNHNNDNKPFKIGVICSFAEDEPISEIIATTKLIPDVEFFLSGDYNRINKKINIHNAFTIQNLHFTGFLEYSKFIKIMSSMDAIMVLTKRNKTLLSGCYEAVMLEKPLITSNFDVLQESFNKGTVFADNSVGQIVNAIIKVQNNYMELEEEIKYLKEEKNYEWNTKISFLKTV